jgi:hypothetical protein
MPLASQGACARGSLTHCSDLRPENMSSSTPKGGWDIVDCVIGSLLIIIGSVRKTSKHRPPGRAHCAR